jgi:hypothetical protein
MPLTPQARQLLESQVTIMLATASAAGQPNVAPMALYWVTDDGRMVLGDLWLKTVVKHVQENPQVQICYWDEDTNTTYKFGGRAAYVTAGPEFAFARARMAEAGTEEAQALKGAVVIAFD